MSGLHPTGDRSRPLSALLEEIRAGLLDEVPSAHHSLLVLATDEDQYRGYLLMEQDALPMADVLALRVRRGWTDGEQWWMHYSYKMDANGLWHCELPWRRAMDRLADMKLRWAVAMWSLLFGWKVEMTAQEATHIARQVVKFAEQEMAAELEHLPENEGRCPCPRCQQGRKEAYERRRESVIGIMKSESQARAEYGDINEAVA